MLHQSLKVIYEVPRAESSLRSTADTTFLNIQRCQIHDTERYDDRFARLTSPDCQSASNNASHSSGVRFVIDARELDNSLRLHYLDNGPLECYPVWGPDNGITEGPAKLRLAGMERTG
jgi:hypothetical protein